MARSKIFSLVLIALLAIAMVGLFGCSKKMPYEPQDAQDININVNVPGDDNDGNGGGGNDGGTIYPPESSFIRDGKIYVVDWFMTGGSNNDATPEPWRLVDVNKSWQHTDVNFKYAGKMTLSNGSTWDCHYVDGVYSKFQVVDANGHWADPARSGFSGPGTYANLAEHTWYFQPIGYTGGSGDNDSNTAVIIAVNPDGLGKSTGSSYRICGTFTNGWEELPVAGKSFYVSYNDAQHFVVTAEDGVPMTNLKVNGNTPPTYAWIDGQYWFAVPFAFPRFTWLEKSQGWKNVQFTFATDITPNVSEMYFLGNCTTAYTKNPSTDGWQKVQMTKVGADSAHLTLANAVEVERHCNVVVVYDGNKEAWPPRWLWANSTRLDHGTIVRFPTGAVDTFTIDYIVRSDGRVETRGPHLLDGVIVEIKP